MKIIKFSSPSCAPCKMLSPVLDSIKEEYGVEVVEINVESEPQKAMAYGVRSVPTLVFEHDGVRVNTIVGMTNRQHILSALGVKV